LFDRRTNYAAAGARVKAAAERRAPRGGDHPSAPAPALLPARRGSGKGGRVLRLLLVCAGGALGSGARYLVATAMARAVGVGLPWGTLAVNASGSFLIALVMGAAATGALSEEGRLLLATGVLGGFTTYSSFNHETLALAAQGRLAAAAGYAALTFCACLAAGLAGLATVRALA
jgi:CrcB protein